jgi:glutathione S-transferase
MHIYGSIASPFVQRCLMVSRAKGHEVEVLPPPGGGFASPDFQAISPMGRIPLLALDDGGHICESSAIAAYLDETLDGPALLPADPVARARVREIEALAVLELGAAMRPVMICKIIGIPGSDALYEPAISQADKGCDALARLVGEGRFATGDALSMADCALVPLLTFANVLRDLPEVEGVLERHPTLLAYHQRMSENPVAARTIREVTEGIAAIRARMAAQAAG